MAEIKKVAIMTGGGDCPSLNAVIRAVTTTAIVSSLSANPTIMTNIPINSIV